MVLESGEAPFPGVVLVFTDRFFLKNPLDLGVGSRV